MCWNLIALICSSAVQNETEIELRIVFSLGKLRLIKVIMTFSWLISMQSRCKLINSSSAEKRAGVLLEPVCIKI